MNERMLSSFIEALTSGTFQDKGELLQRLVKPRDHGLARLREALTQGDGGPDFFDRVMGPILSLVSLEAMNRPLYEEGLTQLVVWLYNTPLLLGKLYALVQDGAATAEQARRQEKICAFLTRSVNLLNEARREPQVRAMALLLAGRAEGEHSPPAEAALLRGALQLLNVLDPKLLLPQKLAPSFEQRTPGRGPACSAQDPPGGPGGHDNDHFNYRDISVLPTSAELAHLDRPYLPLADESNRFLNPAEDASPEERLELDTLHLLDARFRLLREDCVGPMRPPEVQQDCGRHNNGGERLFKLRNARVTGLELGEGRHNLNTLGSFLVAFDSKPKWSKSFWEESRRRFFPIGSMVCLEASQAPEERKAGSAEGEQMAAEPKLFGVVTMRDSSVLAKRSLLGVSFQEGAGSAVGNSLPLQLMLRQHALSAAKAVGHSDVRGDLVMISASFFAYEPVLRSLQRKVELPFAEELLYGQNRPQLYLPERLQVPVGVLKDGVRPLVLSREGEGEDTYFSGLEEDTTLDASQIHALQHAFRQRVSLIQGPPGTGKTFIGSVLAQVILDNTHEKILCLCYTNHALDQFLEHLLAVENKRYDIVRVGGNSKSERLAELNLYELSRGQRFSQADFFYKKDCEREVADCLKTLNTLLARTQGDLTFEYVRDNAESLMVDMLVNTDTYDLQQQQTDIHELVQALTIHDVTDDDDGEGLFTEVGKGGRAVEEDYLFKAWREGGAPPGAYAYRADQATWKMDRRGRDKLYAGWQACVRANALEGLEYELDKLNSLRKRSVELQERKHVQVLKAARVVGCTTTKAAQCDKLLEELAPGVVMIEEAGELLEAHVLASLSKHCKHLILIGDHRQLRPKADCFDLTVEANMGFDLNRSLFERLVVKGQLKSACLEVQHRMRPEISHLIRTLTYPKLVDHPSVENRPSLLGLKEGTSVIFINHAELEDGQSKKKRKDENAAAPHSKTNAYEAELSTEVVRYLLLQGHEAEDMVVLTPYLGQMRIIRRALESGDVGTWLGSRDAEELARQEAQEAEEAEEVEEAQEAQGPLQRSPGPSQRKGVRVSSIDNYQGEEAEIVVISLVRSNSGGQSIGFLRDPERVNVALSRARRGLILIGNAQALTSSRDKKGAELWTSIIALLEQRGQVVEALPAVCAKHRDDAPVLLRTPADFRELMPDGGCVRKCKGRLSCGHRCTLTCHPRACDQVSRCHNPCSRACKRGVHPCPKRCHEGCPSRCEVSVQGVALPCGHTANKVPCHLVDSPGKIVCREQVEHRFVPCQHVSSTECHNATSSKPLCPKPCEYVHTDTCGHQCSGLCGGCQRQASSSPEGPPRPHRACTKLCERLLMCGHQCGTRGSVCHDPAPCQPCKRGQCSVSCAHSVCSKICASVCSSCAEPCEWRGCEHEGGQPACPLPCGAPCARLPCDQRCDKVLSCGHRCPSVCGEQCPDPLKWCQQCGSKRGEVVDMLMMTPFSEVALDEPLQALIVLGCGHALTTESMDGHMELHRAYERSADLVAGGGEEPGEWTSPKRLEGEWKVKVCPSCKVPVTGRSAPRRYGRCANMAQLNTLERKFLISTRSRLKELRVSVAEPAGGGGDQRGRGEALGREGYQQEEGRMPQAQGGRRMGAKGGKQDPRQATLRKYRQLLDDVRKESPTRKMYAATRRAACEADKASGGPVSDGWAVPTTETRMAELDVLEGFAAFALSALEVDEVRRIAQDVIETGLRVAEGKAHLRLQARFRLSLAQLALWQLRNDDVRMTTSRASTTGVARGAAMDDGAAEEEVEGARAKGAADAEGRKRHLRSGAEAHLTWVTQHVGNQDGLAMEGLAEEAETLRKVLAKAEKLTPQQMLAIMTEVGNREGTAGFEGGWTGQGHWFTCPNGHPFFIGECGGAMQESRCPDCGERVGGTNHYLVATNRRFVVPP